MRSLGLDVGDKRIGVAVSDPEGVIAFSLTTIANGDEDTAINDVIKLAGQYDIEHIVVGLPLSLNGEIGQQAKKVMAFADKVSLQAKQSNLGHVDIQMWDERLSTVAANRLMTESGGRYKLQSGTKNKGTKGKGINKNRKSSAKVAIDAVAAAFILQGFLDSVSEGEWCQST
ncbi:MAG: Holliday junction resolvase RuvX [Chloroflexota bacterium]|nr:Holliday junction resolvase RuvX [Chloroflexota bacterium]